MSRGRGRAAVTGLAALIALLVLVAGLPVLLLALGGSPLPGHLPDAAQLGHGLLHRDSSSVVLAVVRDVTWLAWAAFTYAVLAEVQAIARRRSPPRLHLGGLQSVAGRLVALAVLTFTAAPVGTLLATPQLATAAMITAAPHASPLALDSSVQAATVQAGTTVAETPAAGPVAAGPVAASPVVASPVTASPVTAGTAAAQEDAASSQRMSMGYYQLVTVRPGECLWTIAQHYLGDGDRYTEIVSLNLGHDMGSGQVFSDPSVVWPGWVLHVPAAGPGAHHHEGGQGDTAGSTPAGSTHAGHPSRHQHYRQPHHGASPAGHGSTHTLTSVPAPATGDGQGSTTQTLSSDGSAVHSPQQSRLLLIAAFGTGVLAGGAAVSLSRLRHRQRQARRRGRRIPLPASAPVAEAEQRLNLTAAYEPVSALRDVLHDLGAGLVAAGAQLPDITALRLQPAYLDVLLASPAADPPPAPFSVPGGYQGMAWRRWLADEQEDHQDPAGDLLPGLLTIGSAADGYLLVDLEHLQVTEVAGPAGLAGALLRSAAAELTAGQLAGWYDLILVGYPELEALGGRGTCCESLDAALDLLAAKAVTLRRRLGDAPLADVRYHRLTEPGDEDWALTLLVSAETPTSAQLAMLADLAADPGGIAALIPSGGEPPAGHREPALIELAEASDGQSATARVWPLQLEAIPTPLDDADYAALASLFATASQDGDVAAADPPYSGWTWPDDVLAAAEEAGQPSAWDEAGRSGIRSARGGTAAGGHPDLAWRPGPGDGEEADEGQFAEGQAAEDQADRQEPADRDPVQVGQAHWAPAPHWLADDLLTADTDLPAADPAWDGDPAWAGDPPWDRDPAWSAGAAGTEVNDGPASSARDRDPVSPDGTAGRTGTAGIDGPASASEPGRADAVVPASEPVPGKRADPAGGADPAAPAGMAVPAASADGDGTASPVDPPAQDVLRIGVLGSFTINGQPGGLLPAQSQLVLALALNGRSGLSNQQLCYLLGADPDHPKPSDSLRQLIVRTRRQLGRAPDGREWIEHLGGGQYALHPAVRFDWADFDRLTTDGMRARDAHLLRRALRLIRGRPFSGCYYWWLDLATTETVRAQIVDAADVLAALEIAAGDPAAAARAARTGLAGDAAAEQLWRALMRAEHAAGNLVGVREAWNRCLDAISDIAPDGEPHPGTAALYQELLAASGARSGWVPGMTET